MAEEIRAEHRVLLTFFFLEREPVMLGRGWQAGMRETCAHGALFHTLGSYFAALSQAIDHFERATKCSSRSYLVFERSALPPWRLSLEQARRSRRRAEGASSGNADGRI